MYEYKEGEPCPECGISKGFAPGILGAFRLVTVIGSSIAMVAVVIVWVEMESLTR